MSADSTPPLAPVSPDAAGAGPRLAALDFYRGLIVMLMVFVNDIAGVKGTPQALRHMPSTTDGMTITDFVFPAFLFIVGMSLPLALGRKLERGATVLSLLPHVLLRTVGLLVLGVFMVNRHAASAKHMPLDPSVWFILVFVAAALAWNAWHTAPGALVRRLAGPARVAGVVALVALAAVFRRTDGAGGAVHWFDPEWWGILGLIGWAYLCAALWYFGARRSEGAMAAGVALLMAVFIAADKGRFGFLPRAITQHVGIGSTWGSHAGITLAGALLAGGWLARTGAAQKLRFGAGMAGLLAAGAWCTHGLYIISKDIATPPWCLYCAALATVAFMPLWWLLDGPHAGAARVRSSAAARFVSIVGANALLVYMLPSIWYSLLHLFPNGLAWYGGWSWPTGFVRSVAFVLGISATGAALAQGGFRIRL